MIRLKSLLTEGNGPLKGEWLQKGINLAKSLINRGFSKEEASAIVGNMWAESTFNPAATNAIGAFGLLQWLGVRKKELIKFANGKKLNPESLTVQLDFIKFELLDKYDGEYAYEANQFKKAMTQDTVTGKAYAFAKFVERPAGAELASSADSRKIAAKNVYDALTGKKAKTATTSKTSGSSAVKKSSKKQYTVKQGETLGGIANRNKTTIDAILKKNKGLKANKIAVGQKLYI
jgi:LysM repeat protein